MTIDAATTTPTTTPTAMPATFVPPELDDELDGDPVEDAAADAGRVTTTVCPVTTLVTTDGLPVRWCPPCVVRGVVDEDVDEDVLVEEDVVVGDDDGASMG